MKLKATPFFETTAELVGWLKTSKNSAEYSVVAHGHVTIFGDGTVNVHTVQRRGRAAANPGTIASNFGFMVGTLTGKMEHKGDNALAEEIDRRGGVMFVYLLAPE